MSDGEHGHGTKLYASLFTTVTSMTAATNSTAIGNVISITGPSQTRDAIEISTMDSSNKWREYTPGMLDAGEYVFDVNYDGSDSGDAAILGGTNAATGLLKNTSTALTYWLNFNDNGTHTTAVTNWTHHSFWFARGQMTALGHAIPFDDKITQSVTIKLTGEPTYIDIPA